MKTLMAKKKAGFTLIELMIVVAILGILAAIAIPAFATYIRRSKTSEVAGNIEGLFKAVSAYYNKEHSTSAAITATANGHCTVPTAETFPVAQVNDTKQPQVMVPSFEENGGIGYAVGMSYYSFTNLGQGAASVCSNAPGTSATLQATGDLDNDGVSSTFSLAIMANPGNEFYKAGQLFVTNELE